MQVNKAKRMTPEEIEKFDKMISFFEGPQYQQAQIDSSRCRDYKNGKQWTRDELISKKDKGEYAVTINRLKKALDSIVGLLTAGKPKFQALARNTNSGAASDIANKIFDHIWTKSRGMIQYQNAVEYACGDNIGYLHVRENLAGEVIFEALDFERVVVDAKSSKDLYDDAERILIKKFIPIDLAKVMFGLTDEELISDTPKDWTSHLRDSTGGYDQEYETSSYTEEDWYTYKPGRLWDSDKQYVQIYDAYTKEPYPGKDGRIKYKIRIDSFIGYYHKAVRYLPDTVSEYPIIPFYCNNSGNAYKRGFVSYLIQLQDFINSAFGVILKSASVSSSPKIAIPNGSVTGDMASFLRDFADPSKPIFYNGEHGPPSVLSGQPINTAFFGILETLLKEFENASIADDISSYNDQGKQTGGFDLAMKREAILDKLRPTLRRVDDSLSRTAEVCLMFAKAVYTEEQLIYITGAKDRLEAIQINKEVGLDPNNPKSIEQYKEAAKQNGMNPAQIELDIEKAKSDTSFRDGLKAILNPIKDICTDIVVIPGSYSPSYDSSQFQALFALKEVGVDIDNEDLLKHAPIEDREFIAKKASIIRSLMANNEQYENELQELQGTIKKLQDKVFGAESKVREVEHESKLDKQRNDLVIKGRANNKVHSIQMSSQRHLMMKDLQHSIDKILMKVEAEAEALKNTEENNFYNLNTIKG